MSNDFDPYDVIQGHEYTLNKLIQAHNEVAQLSENLADSIVKLNNRLDKLERFVLHNINETE